MPSLSDLLAHTPLAVWAGLAVLVAVGLKQTRARDISAPRLWLVPIVMGGFSLLGTWHAFGGAAQWLACGAWAVGAVAGFASNRALNLPRDVRANADGSFRIGGSLAPLVLFVTIFVLRYVVAVMLAVAPRLAHDPLAAVLAALACGLPTGLLAARSRKVLATRRGPDAVVAA